MSIPGQILNINLSTGEITPQTRDLSDTLGGRGLGVQLLFEQNPPQLDPYSPENLLVFAVGPLTGTNVPTAGRFQVVTKSPLTGTIFDGNSGGQWGARLKAAGFDALVIKGRASKPVYITVKNGNCEIKEAASLWGQEVPVAMAKLKEMEGSKASFACIGPGGENLVRFAAIMNDHDRCLGRGGVGAVMGSKNLKAVVVEGNGKTKVADAPKLDFVAYEMKKLLTANPITSQGLPQFGTGVLVNLINEMGMFPQRNFQESQSPLAWKVSGEEVSEKILKGKRACFACPIACGRITQTSREKGEGPEYETLWALGPQCGIYDLELIAEANYLCNRLGLDTISTGSTIGCAMELNQRGILAGDLKFGAGEKLLTVIRQIAYREGLGAELAEGSRRLAQKHKVPELAMQSKGLEFPAYDPRGAQGQGLGYATSNRGGCHLRSYMIGPEVLGVPKMIDRFSPYGKAGLTIVFQNTNAAMDSLILCRFVGLAVGDEYFARLLSAATGKNYWAQDFQTIGERIWTLERLYNIREGLSRQDDSLPPRLLFEPIKEGPAKGKVVELDIMLDEYYRFRGWDKEGVPTHKKLEQLGLLEVWKLKAGI